MQHCGNHPGRFWAKAKAKTVQDEATGLESVPPTGSGGRALPSKGVYPTITLLLP